MWKKSSAVCYFDLGATREQIIRKLKKKLLQNNVKVLCQAGRLVQKHI